MAKRNQSLLQRAGMFLLGGKIKRPENTGIIVDWDLCDLPLLYDPNCVDDSDSDSDDKDSDMDEEIGSEEVEGCER